MDPADRVSPRWIARYRACATWRYAGWASKAELTCEAYRRKAEAMIGQWVSDAAVQIRATESNLVSFLRAGCYEPMSKTRPSGGNMRNLAARRQLEHDVFDIRPGAALASRPIAAYLAGSDEKGAIETYGEIILELDTAVRERAYFILGDLFDVAHGGPMFVPRPLLTPSLEVANCRRSVIDAQNLAAACGQHAYAEALIFDGVRTSDIVKVTYTGGASPSTLATQLICNAGWQLGLA